MIDKVQKIREEIEKLHKEYRRKEGAFYYRKALRAALFIIDSLQKEPVKDDRLTFKAIPRLLDMIEPTDRAKAYTAKLADTLEVEGYSTDAKVVRECLKIMNGEKVSMATMDEEPVSDVKTRVKEIFDSCEKIDVSDSEKNRVAFGLLELEGFAKMFYKMGKQQEEPVSEGLEEVSKNYALNNTPWDDCKDEIQEAFKAGAKWQKAKDESTTEDLGEYTNELSKQFPEVSFAKLSRISVRVAKWQKQHLWKPADGDDLPEIDREVIAILDYDFGHYKVVYAHRPNPNGWNGTNIDTEEKEHFEPVTYGKGGWNQPHVLYWLDTKMPYEEK